MPNNTRVSTFYVLKQIRCLYSLAFSLAGRFKKLTDSASEANGTVEPVNALPSVHADQFNMTGCRIEAEHSPISSCINSIQQTEMEPRQNNVEKY